MKKSNSRIRIKKNVKLPSFEFLIHLLGEVNKTRSDFEFNNTIAINKTDFSSDVLTELDSIIVTCLWLLHPNQYNTYIREGRGNIFSGLLGLVPALMVYGEAKEVKFINIRPYQFSFTKEYYTFKSKFSEFGLKHKKYDLLKYRFGIQIQSIQNDILNFKDNYKKFGMSDIFRNKFNLNIPRYIIYYFALIYYIEPFLGDNSSEEDRIKLLKDLSIAINHEIRPGSIYEGLIQEIDQDIAFIEIENIVKKTDYDSFEKLDPKMKEEYETFIQTIDEEKQREEEIKFIKSYPDKYSALIVIISAGMDSVVIGCLFIIDNDDENQNLSSSKPIMTYVNEWMEFERNFILQHPYWEKYSQAKLTKLINELSSEIAVDLIQEMEDEINELGLNDVKIAMSQDVLVDFEKVGEKVSTSFSREFRFSIGSAIKEHILQIIKPKGYDLLSVKVTEEDLIEENDPDFSNLV